MAKKKVKKKDEISFNTDSAMQSLSEEIATLGRLRRDTEKRIDRIVDAISKSKNVKGM